MRMPFGKYRGYDLDYVPVEYLEWLLENVPLRGRLLYEVEDRVTVPYRIPAEVEMPTYEQLKSVYRKMAVKWHPDKTNGSNEPMKAVNDFWDKIKTVV